MPSTLSPNMSLTIPGVGTEPGPQWATDLNDSLSTVDGHDHSPGSGVQITPLGMLISSDLAFLGNNATQLRAVRFTPQNPPLSGGADVGEIFVSGIELWYAPVTGSPFPLTNNGSVNSSPGNITGLTSPASVLYNPGGPQPTFTFYSSAGSNTEGALDAGQVIIRKTNVPNSNGIALTAPAGLPNSGSISYDFTLPVAPPSQLSLMTMDSAGNFAAWPTSNPSQQSFVTISSTGGLSNLLQPDFVTLDIQSVSGHQILEVAAGGIGPTQLATGAAVANIASNTLPATAIDNFSVTPTQTAALTALFTSTLPSNNTGSGGQQDLGNFNIVVPDPLTPGGPNRVVTLGCWGAFEIDTTGSTGSVASYFWKVDGVQVGAGNYWYSSLAGTQQTGFLVPSAAILLGPGTHVISLHVIGNLASTVTYGGTFSQVTLYAVVHP